jgi:hypothetical protein
MRTVVELPEFQSRAKYLLGDSERQSIATYLATHPEAGSILKGTGGIRKLRWAAKGKGKSGGVRVVYFFHDRTMPLFLLTMFAKDEQKNLSKRERNELAKVAALLAKNYGAVNERDI